MKLRNSKKKGIIKAANAFQPWDYGFMLELEYQSLKLMDEYYSKRQQDNKNIKLAIKLLDIILEKDSSLSFKDGKSYSDKFINTKYINTRNWTRFFPEDKNKEMPCIKDVLRIEKAWYLYNLLRLRELRNFWD